MTVTLASLAETLGPPDETLRDLLFEVADEGLLIEAGTAVDSERILESVPGFVGSALDVLAGLPADKRALVRLNPLLFAMLVDEAQKLQLLYAEHAAILVARTSGRVERESAARRETREGIALRNSVYDSLRSALAEDQLASAAELKSTADTPERLASALRALARFLGAVFAGDDAATRARFDLFNLTPADAAALVDKAARIERAGTITAAPSRKILQARLDYQDGRVLFLVERILRAFRAAARQDRTIPVPELRSLAWLFETARATRKSRPDAALPANAPAQ